MTPKTLNTAIAEAERFLKAARAALKSASNETYFEDCRLTAAAKRSSMDLTRALANMRKPG